MAADGEKQTIPGLTQRFAEDTSMHGVARVASRRSFLRKILWLIFVLTALGVALYNIITVVSIYLSRPVSTVLSIEHNTKLSFPAVTFCNLNPIRLSQLQSSTNNSDILTLSRLLNVDNEGALNVNNYLSSEEALLAEFSNTDPDDQFALTVLISGLVSHMEPEVKKQLGHDLQHMLMKCQFGGKLCHEHDFEYFYNNKYGNCYIFNADGNWTTRQTGPLYGLTMELYIQEDEYVGLLANTLGVKVLITDQRDVPVPDDEGVVASPGFNTYIGLSKQEIARTEHPHGNCLHTHSEGAIVDIIHGWGERYSYSNRGCMTACLQINIIKLCGCCLSSLPCSDIIFRKVLGDMSASFRKCLVADGKKLTPVMEKDIQCTVEVYEKYTEDELQCSTLCGPSCRETAFPKEVSTGLWPSSHIMSHIRNKVKNKHETHNLKIPDITNLSLTEDFISRNTLKLHIYYKLLNHESVSTRPSYDLENLIADIGGSTGLWLGFSILTFLEIIELLIDIAICMMNRSKSSVKPLKGDRGHAK